MFYKFISHILNKEYEVRVLDIKQLEIREKLKSLWATFKWIKNFKRYLYVFKDNEDKWLRLRTDWNTTFIAIKEIVWDEIWDVKEFEIEMCDFLKSKILLDELWLVHRRYEENKRESWEFDWIEFDIDSWPLIPTFLEVEWKNKEEVLRWLELLWFNELDSTTLWVHKIFENYWINILSMTELKF